MGQSASPGLEGAGGEGHLGKDWESQGGSHGDNDPTPYSCPVQ